jgi:hypothetical protein
MKDLRSAEGAGVEALRLAEDLPEGFLDVTEVMMHSKKGTTPRVSP